MALNHRTITANSSTATLLVKVSNGSGKVNCTIANNDSTNAVFIGTSSVSTSGTSQGLKLGESTNVQLQVDGGDSVYVIAAAGTPSVTVLWQGN